MLPTLGECCWCEIWKGFGLAGGPKPKSPKCLADGPSTLAPNNPEKERAGAPSMLREGSAAPVSCCQMRDSLPWALKNTTVSMFSNTAR